MPMTNVIPRLHSDYQHWISVSTRYSDQDPMQHINNVAITAFLESGRFSLFSQLFANTPLPSQCLVLAGLSVDYLREITFPDPVEVGGRLASIGDRSITTQYAIFQRDVCCVVSQSINVFFDPATRRSAEPPAEVRPTIKRLRTQLES